MSVQVFTKKSLISYLQKNLKDDEPIILGLGIDGNVTAQMKKNTFKMPVLMPGTPFKSPIRDLLSGDMRPFAFVVCTPDIVIGAAKTLFNAVHNAG